MIRLWEFLWHGCWHDWHLHTAQKLVDKKDNSGIPIGHNMIYECAKCGRFKSVEL